MPRLVAIEAVGDADFVAGLREAWEAGDAVLPVDPRLPPPARAALLSELDAGGPVEPGDALVVATSGTTGRPRGVVLTHDAVRASAMATSSRLGVGEGDRWLACLPLAHVGGLGVVTRALVTGTPLVVHPGFDPAAASSCGASLVALVPTALRRLDTSAFRLVVLGGSAPPAVLPPNVVATWGMTETGSGVVYDGVPLEGVEVRIDPSAAAGSGAEGGGAGSGEGAAHLGEILVRGPMLLRAYRSGEDPKDAGGWLRTGDLGGLDGEGRLVVHGRRGDLIVTGGENVWPHPVEAVLATHPGVAEVAVAGRPDPEWGQRVVAFVVPAVGAGGAAGGAAAGSGGGAAPAPTLAHLRALVKEQLPAFCAPRQLVLLDRLPRTAIGKLARHRLP